MPAPAAGDAAAGKLLRADGTWAAPASGGGFPVTGISAKSAAYPITAADKGTMFDLTGSPTLTLPAVSGASASSPLYYHFNKRDGSGVAILSRAGSDAFAGGSTSIRIYQEQFTVVSFGGPWYLLGRQRGWVDVGSFSVTSGTASVTITAGAGDAEIRDIEIDFENFVPASSDQLRVVVNQGGAAGTFSGHSIYSSTTAVAAAGASTLYFGNNGTEQVGGKLEMKNIQSAVAYGIRGIANSGSLNSTTTVAGAMSTAGALSSLTLSTFGGTTIFSMLYNVRLYRP